MAPWTRTIRTLALAGLAAGALAACEPSPPRLQLTVDTTQSGADDHPGDGVCGSAAAGGACTLSAAIQEGNAAPQGAEITVEAGRYRHLNPTITGDIVLRAAESAEVSITETNIRVSAGATFGMSGINTSTSLRADPPSWPDTPATAVWLTNLFVSGQAVVTGSIINRIEVLAGGQVLLVDTVVEHAGVLNAGSLFALRSSLLGNPQTTPPDSTALRSLPGASSYLVGSVVANPALDTPMSTHTGGQGTCAGPAPASGSHLFVEVPCGPMDGDGDGSGDARLLTTVTMVFNGGYQQVGKVHEVLATSPLIDAIPLGHPACPEGALDVYGNPRGVDGDGDGVGGCDIGAVEHQP